MGKRKKRSTPSPPQSSDETEYSVITAARKIEGKWQYLVKWYKFEDHENSWEPQSNFNDCERLLNSFWAEVGEYKREKAREGIEIFPRQQWIDKEKTLFSETRKSEDNAAREVDSDEDDVPLRKLVGKSSKDIDGSDDDEPLSVSLRRPTTFKETGLLKPNKQKSEGVAKHTGIISNKMPKKFAGTDVTFGKKKTLPIADKVPPLAPVNQPRPRPSKPPANSPTSQSPTRVTVFSDPQTSSLSSLRQTANQAAGSDRSLGKTQLLPPSSIKSSSSLSTKARIATDMAKEREFVWRIKISGHTVLGQSSISPRVASTHVAPAPLQRTQQPTAGEGSFFATTLASASAPTPAGRTLP
ncbi:hypothetical protein BJ322DRAFT_757278 [Thelephora terrestris]|uniref:Chromo domain-containing protein n=1 Tax=Thelephora terrestris TaxID=56493 RepID=A0A9P6L7G6_9AGAM|nr:hypothetical protein BJ322DRAFT_757278 [Thelephora terrestris]